LAFSVLGYPWSGFWGFYLCLYLTQEFCTASLQLRLPTLFIQLFNSLLLPLNDNNKNNSNKAGRKFLSENSHSNLISPKQSQNVMSLRFEPRGNRRYSRERKGKARGMMPGHLWQAPSEIVVIAAIALLPLVVLSARLQRVPHTTHTLTEVMCHTITTKVQGRSQQCFAVTCHMAAIPRPRCHAHSTHSLPHRPVNRLAVTAAISKYFT